MCNMKKILLVAYRVVGLDKNIHFVQTRILPWLPGRQVTSGSNESWQPTKGTSAPPGGPTCAICKQILLAAYWVVARTRILTWANMHITLTPWGSSFSGSNASQPTKGTSTPPGGPTCTIWKESSTPLQSYGPDKNITLTPLGDKVMGSNESLPPKGTSRTPRGPTCAVSKESSQRLQSYGPDKNIHLGK